MKAKNIIVRTVIIALCLTASLPGIACEACKKQQPKLLQGITHGAGPDSNWDYVIVSVMLIVTLYSFYAMVRCLIKPKEKNYKDIKNMILN